MTEEWEDYNKQTDDFEDNENSNEDIGYEDTPVESNMEEYNQPNFIIKDLENNEQYDTEVDGSYYGPYKISQPIQPKPIPKQDKKRKKESGNFILRTSLFVLSAVLFGVISSVVFQFTNSSGLFYSSNEEETNLDSISQKETQESSITDTTLVQTGSASIVKHTMPSIVAITNKSVQETRGLFGSIQSYETESSGSGIIIGQSDKELFIVSNNHVVENAKTLSVCFYSETKDGDNLDHEAVVEATIQGTDPRNDLAVIGVKIKDIPRDTLEVIKVAVLGDSDVLDVGQPVVAIGNALGVGQSVTQGIISALDREVTVDAFSNKLIQTDAAINFGNSGGALLNMNGEVIGINVIKLAAETVEGMGYAIPISTAQPIIDDLMNRNSLTQVKEKGYLGISGVQVTEDISNTYDLPLGLFINQVEEGSPADLAGLKKGDVLVAFDGREIDSMETLQSIISYYKASEEVEVTLYVYEDNEYIEQNITVVLGKRES
ncbi:MAG TPA: trypsin-like peptidase domain-containing protein [Candidatus Merdenecus merdavium]|nr:trypsin-like peptidase domain-containing protein [Candidatus Merdenecus merdavium]